jgi:antitoxin component YwqK of YwqJK toxin-antitoxin module
MQDKRPYNEKRQKHGYWETNWEDGKPCFKTNYINGKLCGLYQWYNRSNRKLIENEYYAK